VRGGVGNVLSNGFIGLLATLVALGLGMKVAGTDCGCDTDCGCGTDDDKTGSPWESS